MIVTAAKRKWLPSDIAALHALWHNKKITNKQIARQFGINYKSLNSGVVRHKLGLLGRRESRGGANNTRGLLSTERASHPLVKRLYEILNEQKLNAKEVSLGAGFCYSAIYGWRTKIPSIENFDRIARKLEYKLELVKDHDRQDYDD